MTTPIKPIRGYEQIVEILRHEIQKSTVGQRIDSIGILSKRFSVGEATIRYALLILAQEGLVEIKHGSGTYVCERRTTLRQPGEALIEPCGRRGSFVKGAPATKTSPSYIALLTGIDFMSPVVSRFAPTVFWELRRYFQAAGYRTRILFGDDPQIAVSNSPWVFEGLEEDLVAEMARGQVCGVVALYARSETLDWKRQAAARSIPIVGDFEYPYTVSFPIKSWITAAVQHLHAQGRRRLAMLSCGRGEWAQTFSAELGRCGLDFHPEWGGGDIHPVERGAGWSGLREIWTSRRERPDGLIVVDDQLTSDACLALRELGVRVPEQLTIVTHANSDCPLHASLPVMKVEYDTIAHARLMGDMMLKLLRNERVEQPHLVSSDRFKIYPTPVVAPSTGPLSETILPSTSESMLDVER